MERRLTPRPCLGEDGSAGRKIESCKPHLAGNRRAALAPAEPSGNHQVQHEEKTAFELEDDALAETAKADDRAPFDDVDGGSGVRSRNGFAMRSRSSG